MECLIFNVSNKTFNTLKFIFIIKFKRTDIMHKFEILNILKSSDFLKPISRIVQLITLRFRNTHNHISYGIAC